MDIINGEEIINLINNNRISTSDSADVGLKNDKNVIAVNPRGEKEDVVGWAPAHTGDGIRHQSTIYLFLDKKGRILLTQRSQNERLWDQHWEGTVSAHNTGNQTKEPDAGEKIESLLGISTSNYSDVRTIDRFEYKRYYQREYVDWEIMSVKKITISYDEIDINKNRISAHLWADYDDLCENPHQYRQLEFCPWFEIAFRRDYNS